MMGQTTMKLQLKYILQELLDRHGLSITKLAKETGVPKQTISNWLSGMNPKNMSQIKQVANYFKVSIDYLVFADQKTALPRQSPMENYAQEINAGIFEVVLRRIALPYSTEKNNEDSAINSIGTRTK